MSTPKRFWFALLLVTALLMVAAVSDVTFADKSYRSRTGEKVRIVSTKKGRVHHVLCYNKSGADFYLQIYDTNAVPGASATVDFSPLLIPNGSTGYMDFVNGHPFNVGLTLVASTTDTNLTLITTSNALFTVSYQERGE